MSTPIMLDIQTIGAFCGAILTMGALAKAIVSLSTKEVKRDIHDVAKSVTDLEHDLKNQSMKTAGLESERTKDVERIVKLELRQENIEKGQAEIKADAARNHRETLDAMTAWAKQFAESIRELRTVSPKG
jgi:biopolymer transport protein ExbB/TolQ